MQGIDKTIFVEQWAEMCVSFDTRQADPYIIGTPFSLPVAAVYGSIRGHIPAECQAAYPRRQSQTL